MEPVPASPNLDYIIFKITEGLNNFMTFLFGGDGFATKLTLENFFDWPFLRFISFSLSFIAFAGIVYLLIRLYEVNKDRHLSFRSYFYHPSPVSKKNVRWQNVVELFMSNNPSDWRVAIIEADSMLDDLILRLGYPGETMGERMKTISQADFPTINLAWEVHKLRNRIAHEGTEFNLDQYKKDDAYRKYETIFRDSGYIS